MEDRKAVPELASPREQVDVKQVILGAPHWFLLRYEVWGVLQELVVAVTGFRYGHPAPVTANTQLQLKNIERRAQTAAAIAAVNVGSHLSRKSCPITKILNLA